MCPSRVSASPFPHDAAFSYQRRASTKSRGMPFDPSVAIRAIQTCRPISSGRAAAAAYAASAAFFSTSVAGASGPSGKRFPPMFMLIVNPGGRSLTVLSSPSPTSNEPAPDGSVPVSDQHAGQKSQAAASPDGTYANRSPAHSRQGATAFPQSRHASRRPRHVSSTEAGGAAHPPASTASARARTSRLPRDFRSRITSRSGPVA